MVSKKQQQQATQSNANTLSRTFAWFEEARPAPTSKQFHTQTGVHFEEVAEMVEEIRPLNPVATVLLHDAKVALKALAKYLKEFDGTITVEPENRQDFLDSICDQIVTATGVGHHCGFPVVEALDEVNASNFSKFVDGKAIFDENLKVKKGPHYWKADLAQFLPARIPALLD